MVQPPNDVMGNGSGRMTRLPLSSVWVVASIALPLLIVTVARMGTVDLTYHLRAGALMLDSRTLVRTDTFTFTAAGLPWVDQQWLSQVILASSFRLGGWLAMAVLRSALAGVALWCVYAACRAGGAARRRAAWLTLGSSALLLPTLQLRPQLFGVACFAATLWLLSGRKTHPRRLPFLVPLILLWANLHGTFFLMIGVIGLAWLQDVHDRERSAWRLVVVGFACIAATAVNPYGFRVWRYVLELSNNDVVRGLVQEWQPTSFDSYSGAAFLVSVPLFVLLLTRSGRTLTWPILLSLATFFLIGVMSVRGVYWWAMAVPVLVASTSASQEPAVRADPANVVNVAIVGVLAAGLLLMLGRWMPFHSPEPVPEKLVTEAPAGITRALRATLAPGERLLSAQAWGSWFEFALPRNPVAVDSRIELIPASAWTLYADISQGRAGWQQSLEAWHVRVLALSPLQQGALLERIAADSGWQRTYHDDDGSVFVRR